MLKLSEYKGEEAVEILADILDPATEILADKEVEKIFGEKNYLKLAKYILKQHKASILELLAILERKDVEEYKKEVNIFTLPKTILELLNDKDLLQFFTYAGTMNGTASFGSATESTKAEDK